MSTASATKRERIAAVGVPYSTAIRVMRAQAWSLSEPGWPEAYRARQAPATPAGDETGRDGARKSPGVCVGVGDDGSITVAGSG